MGGTGPRAGRPREQHRPRGALRCMVLPPAGSPTGTSCPGKQEKPGPWCYWKEEQLQGKSGGASRAPLVHMTAYPSPGQSSTAFQVLRLRLRSDRSRRSVAGRPLRALQRHFANTAGSPNPAPQDPGPGKGDTYRRDAVGYVGRADVHTADAGTPGGTPASSISAVRRPSLCGLLSI